MPKFNLDENKIHDILNKYKNKEPEKSIPKVQLSLFKDYKELTALFSSISATLFTFGKKYNDYSFMTMFGSVEKTKRLLYSIQGRLKYYSLTKDEILVIEKNKEIFNKRLEQIIRVLKEDLKRTDEYLYFCYLIDTREDIYDYIGLNSEESREKFFKASEAYNTEHRQEYEAFIPIKEAEIQLYNNILEKRKADKKQEKEIKKDIKETEIRYLAEIKRNNTKRKQRDRLLGRAGNSYHYKERKVYPI